MKLIVTGSDGQLGTALRKLSGLHKEHTWVFLSRTDLDITDHSEVEKFLKNYSCGKAILINCAAYTDVEKAESEPEAAFRINSSGVRNLAEISKSFGIKLIHISTDFVFNGLKAGPYKESDEPDPVSVYGKSKLEGEKAVFENIKNCLIIRTSWLYSTTHNTFVNKIIARIRTNDQIKVVDDETGSPTYANDLAEALFHICERISKTGEFKTELYHYCNAGSVSRYEYAKKISEFSKCGAEVIPVKSNELAMKAKRPAHSSLDNSKIMTDFGLKIRKWDKALKDAVERINAE